MSAAPESSYVVPVLRRPDSGRDERDLFEDVFARRVAQVANGSIRVVSVDRSAGSDVVVTVHSTTPGVDAAAICVGADGARLRDVEAWFPGQRITVVNGLAGLTEPVPVGGFAPVIPAAS
jgi:transcription termination/antitermination protein NusA